MNNRFLIDYANPDAGIGHSLGFINRAVKIAMRNNLLFAYSENQLIKSSHVSWKWRLKQTLRILRGSKKYESHNIGNDLNYMLGLNRILPNRDEVVSRIKSRELRLIELPFPEFPIPSNNQIDGEVYEAIDRFIKSYPEPNTVFKLNNKNSGDYEYGATREWFLKAYRQARIYQPIFLEYEPDKLNIALHIRRGDLLPGRQFSDLSSRMLPDAWYLDILNIIIHHSNKNLSIHIFSEGKDGKYHSENGTPFSWRGYFRDTPHKVHEHIDSDFMGTFHHLLNADVLIGSKSGMSHLAGMLGKHMKIMPKMWHSYRGADQLLEVSDLRTELKQEEITKYLQQYL